MEVGTIVKAIIAAVMLIVVVTVVVIPILQDATYNQLGNNEPSEYATTAIVSGEYTTTETGFAIDGTEIGTFADKEWVIISDTIAILRYSSTQFVVYNFGEGEGVALAKVVIDSTAGTWSGIYSGTAYTGSLGTNAMLRYTSGDKGVYEGGSFYIDKNDKIATTFTFTSVVVGETVYQRVQVLISGTANNLSVIGLAATASGTTTYLDTTGATAAITTGLTEPNAAVYGIASPEISVTFSIDDTSVTKTVSNPVIAGPLTFTQITDEGGAIKGMLDIVPLLMMVGVIIMILGVAILRR